MTSNPSSRRPRASTLAPRSWPSRPGLAIRTRMGVARSSSVMREGFYGVPEPRRQGRQRWSSGIDQGLMVEVIAYLRIVHDHEVHDPPEVGQLKRLQRTT